MLGGFCFALFGVGDYLYWMLGVLEYRGSLVTGFRHPHPTCRGRFWADITSSCVAKPRI